MDKTVFEDELLTADELASKLKVRKEWLYQNICAGTLPFPHVKVGHHLRFPASGVRQYIEKQTRKGIA